MSSEKNNSQAKQRRSKRDGVSESARHTRTPRKSDGPASSQIATMNGIQPLLAGDVNVQILPVALSRLNGLWRRINANTRRWRYAASQAAATMSIYLQSDAAAWAVFCEHPAWENAKVKGRPKRSDQSNTLNFVMRFVVGVERAESKTANRHKLAVEWLLAHDVEAENIAQTLRERGGVDGVLKERNGSTAEADEGGDDDSEGDLDDDDLFSEGDNSGNTSPAKRTKPPSVNKKENKPVSAPKETVARKASGGGSNGNVYLPVKLLLSKKDRIDILASDPVDRILLFQIKVSAIEDGKVVASVEEWGDLETQEEARARLAR